MHWHNSQTWPQPNHSKWRNILSICFRPNKFEFESEGQLQWSSCIWVFQTFKRILFSNRQIENRNYEQKQAKMLAITSNSNVVASSYHYTLFSEITLSDNKLIDSKCYNIACLVSLTTILKMLLDTGKAWTKCFICRMLKVWKTVYRCFYVHF